MPALYSEFFNANLWQKLCWLIGTCLVGGAMVEVEDGDMVEVSGAQNIEPEGRTPDVAVAAAGS